MLQTRGVRHTYDGRRYLQLPDLDCAAGEQWLVLGQSGSGKTTFLNLIGGLLACREGSLLVNGKAVHKLSGSSLDRFRGKHIGIVFQKNHFIGALNVLENLLIAQRMSGIRPDKARAHQMLERLNIGDKATAHPAQLSVGEQQRASVARALMNRPVLVLADEPTSALDDINCKEVIALLENAAWEEQSTLLIVTHDQRLKDHFPHQIHLSHV